MLGARASPNKAGYCDWPWLSFFTVKGMKRINHKLREKLRIPRASLWLQDLIDQLILLPLAPQQLKAKWPFIWQELKPRAAVHHTSVKWELMVEARQALSLAVQNFKVPTRLLDPFDPESPRAVEYTRKKLQPKMEKLVMEAILGPGWRRKTKEEPFLDPDPRLSPEEPEEPESPVSIAYLSDPRLSPRERQLLKAIVRTDFIADAADVLGIRASTARSMLTRIRRKLA